jgi:hypothetical protein
MTSNQFVPQNTFESTLVAAATDPSARPKFYEALLAANVLVVPAGDPPPIVDGVVPVETTVSFAAVNVQGVAHIPFFSSESRLPRGTQYLGLAAIDFLRMTSGSNLVLNPGADYGKAFTPTEIASILDGSILKPEQTVVIKGGEKQLIGQPKDYPSDFAAALSRYFSSVPAVQRAFLAQHFIAGVHTEPALLVAVEADDVDFEKLCGGVGVIAKDTRNAKNAVDIVRLKSDARGYFADQKPIYEKKKSVFDRLFK